MRNADRVSSMREARRACRVVVALLCTLFTAACEADDGPVQEPVPMPDPTPVEYPVALWDRKVEGETEVLVHVNQFGDVDSARVAKTSGYAEFDSAAVAGARRLRFTPARRGDRRVAMGIVIPIRFAQESATVGTVRGAGRNE